MTVPPVVVPPTEPTEEEESEEESPVVTPPAGEGPEIHAEIGTGFQQNPLVPAEVTWHYSASATRTVVTGGKAKTERVPLPKGELAFFVDGKLVCEIEAGGAIAKSACTVALQRLGAHEVETIFSGEEGSGTVSRTDYVNKYPTQTNLQASVEPTAPEYLDIGPNKYGFEQYGFEVGRLRISGSTTPAGYPTFDCEGLSSGCLEPEVSLRAHNGSVSVPLYAQNRPNPATGKEEWKVEFEATDPALRETGQFWQYPEESVGAQYFHAVSEPSPTYYEPSEITLPLNLNGGHYPFHRWMHLAGEAGPSVAAVEGVPQKVVTIGTYDKFDGPAEWMKISSHFFNVTGETEGCVYTLAVDGTLTKERRTARREGWEFLNGWPGYAAGPHTFEIYVEREAGAGPGPCKIQSGTFEVWEVMH